MNTTKDFHIFYSWQSDLPASTNLRAIRNAIRTASCSIEEECEVRIVLDEATRGDSGSPNIPMTILQKITPCDLFVCDLSTINTNAAEEIRKTPNPNVLFELGYAVALLGWGRIIMLFNTSFGNFPNDLPFDIDRHRASPYSLSKSDDKNKANLSSLNALLKDAVRTVIEKDPLRPSETSNKTPEEVRRVRDIENLTWVLSTIHLPTIDQMIITLPHQLDHKVFHFWESFRGRVDNSLFFLYDTVAYDYIKEVFKGWEGCLAHGEQYSETANPNYYTFSNPGDFPLHGLQMQAWDNINKSRLVLKIALDHLLSHIRSTYIEINFDELSHEAWREYTDYSNRENCD
ncbi:hypothetical protein ABRP60_13155 [Pectobacterium brasiliense]|uniref:hypothetical protein n=1 Tax=Pectobacterium brasiliense TaxID=180957 RepID=UPI0032EC37CD